MIRLLIAEDQSMVRGALALLALERDIEVVGQAGANRTEAARTAREKGWL